MRWQNNFNDRQRGQAIEMIGIGSDTRATLPVGGVSACQRAAPDRVTSPRALDHPSLWKISDHDQTQRSQHTPEPRRTCPRKRSKALGNRRSRHPVLDDHHYPILAAALGALGPRTSKRGKSLTRKGWSLPTRFGRTKKAQPMTLTKRDDRPWRATRLLRELGLSMTFPTAGKRAAGPATPTGHPKRAASDGRGELRDGSGKTIRQDAGRGRRRQRMDPRTYQHLMSGPRTLAS